MAFLTVKIQPGVKTVATPTLLNANIVASNLIRWRGGLPEKYGGWMNFFTNMGSGGGPGSTTVVGITREMWAWADLNIHNHLAFAGSAGVQVLSPITGVPPAAQDVSPQYVLSQGITDISTCGWTGNSPAANTAAAANTSAGGFQVQLVVGQDNNAGIAPGQFPVATSSFQTPGTGAQPTRAFPWGSRVTLVNSPSQVSVNPAVAPPGITGDGSAASDTIEFRAPVTRLKVTDPTVTVNTKCSVTFQTHIPLGDGMVLFGTYKIVTPQESDGTINAGQYVIEVPPGWGFGQGHATTQTLGMLFSTVPNSPVVTLSLGSALNNLNVGDTFTVVLPTTVGGITLQGFYEIYAILSNVNGWKTNFQILANQPAVSQDHQPEGNLGTGGLNGTPIPQALYWMAPPPPPSYAASSGHHYPPLPSSPDYGSPAFGSTTADDWSMANFGSKLLAAPRNGPLFVWDPTSGEPALQRIAEAPETATGFFVGMPEQQIIVYGASTFGTQDPLLVAWSDNADYNTWTAAVDNQAGTYRLTRGSKIIGGLQTAQQAMLWTDVGLWAMAYIGYPDVFGFSEIAQGCGLIAKHAVTVYGPQTFWMSRDGFWIYTNGAVQRLPCEVWDVIIKNLNSTRNTNGDYIYWPHIRAAANSDYDEVAWHFPSQAATNGENDSVIKYNTVTGEWDYSLSVPQQGMVGSTPLYVTEWIDNNVFGHPISSMIAAPTVISLTVSASAAAGGSTLTFPSIPAGILRSMTVAGQTNPSSIAAGTVVRDVVTQVNLSYPLQGGGVKAGDMIMFLGPGPPISAPALLTAASGTTLLTFSFLPSGVAVGASVRSITTPNSIYFQTVVNSVVPTGQMNLNLPLAANVNAGDVFQFSGVNSMILQHEMGTDANGQPINWMMQTGFFMLSDGEDKVFVDWMLPDFRWRRWALPQSTSATVEITLYTAEEPDDPQDTWVPYGPFIVTNASGAVEVRCRGRYFFAQIQGNDLGSFVRLGGIKFRAAPDGRN